MENHINQNKFLCRYELVLGHLVAGTLPAQEEIEVISHVGECTICGEELTESFRILFQQSPEVVRTYITKALEKKDMTPSSSGLDIFKALRAVSNEREFKVN